MDSPARDDTAGHPRPTSRTWHRLSPFLAAAIGVAVTAGIAAAGDVHSPTVMVVTSAVATIGALFIGGVMLVLMRLDRIESRQRQMRASAALQAQLEHDAIAWYLQGVQDRTY